MQHRVYVIAIMIFTAGCQRKVAIGPYRVPKSPELAVRIYDQPTAAILTTTQGNQVVMRMFPKTDLYAADYLNISDALSRQIRPLPRENVRWIRAVAHQRADGAQVMQVDHRRINGSSDITSPEVISVYRFIHFRQHVVRVDGLLTKGDLERDFAEIDAVLEGLDIRE